MSGVEYRIDGEVDLFERENGWYYVAVPTWITEELVGLGDRGLIAVRAAVGSTNWDTSLLPMGDGTHFVALNKQVRSRNDLDVGDPVTLSFVLRER